MPSARYHLANGSNEIWETVGPNSHHFINDEVTRLLPGRPDRRRTVRLQGEGIGWFGAVFLIVNAALGAGLLNFPQAFQETGGVILAAVVQAVLMVFIIPALIILIYCSDKNYARTLQDVMLEACGKRGQQLTSLCVVLYCFGTCVTFLIIIGDQFDRVFASTFGPHFCHTWYLSRNFTMVVSSIVIILPFCYPKRIDFLKYVSSVGVIAILYVVALIVSEYYLGNEPRFPPQGPQMDNWTNSFFVVPVICFGYQCHVSVVPIYSCMRERSLKNIAKSILLAIIICVIVYNLAAIYGSMTFGPNIPADILEGYDANKPYVLVGIIAIALKTYTTYPILLFCGREAMGNLWIDVGGHNEVWAQQTEKLRRLSIASVWFVLSIVIAVFIPNIGDIIKLLGSLAAIFIFIFPGLCLLQHALDKDPCLYLIRDRLLVIIAFIFITTGCFLFGVVTVQGIKAISSHRGSVLLCA